tara:strand:+ start:1033 stop:1230 length:198 start_codon:yes stop_codon:yes gene_type:complete
MTNFEKIKKNELNYLKQYPNEENPFNWVYQVNYLIIADFMEKRNGRKILLKIKTGVLDGGELYYA